MTTLKVGDRIQLNDKHPNSGDVSRNYLDGKDYAWPLAGAHGTIVKVDRAYYWVQFDEYPCGDDEGFPVHRTHIVNHPEPVDTLAALQAERDALADRVRALEGALAWYAEDGNYLIEKVAYDKSGSVWYAYVPDCDIEEVARAALEGRSDGMDSG